MKKVILAIVVIFLISIVAFGFSLVKDEKPPLDSDLKLDQKNIPEGENGFYYFKKAADIVYYPKTKDKIVNEVLDEEKWDTNIVEEVVGKNKETFEYIDKGLECKKIMITGLVGYETEMPYIIPWRNIAKLMSIKSLYYFKQNKQEEAFNEVFKILEFGQKIESSKGCLIVYLVGSSIKEIGLKRLRYLLQDSKLSINEINKYIENIEKYKSDKKGLANAFKVEYLFAKNAISMFKDINKLKNQEAEMIFGKDLGFLMKGPISIFMFKPNKTKRMFADAIRKSIASIFVYYKDVDEFEVIPKSKIELFISGNAIGEIIYGWIMPATNRVIQMRCKEDFLVEGTRIAIALKAYKEKNGDLPNKLDDLIPEYFDIVPIDPFNGESIRYDLNKRVIYSVGRDLKDDGGEKSDGINDFLAHDSYTKDDIVINVDI